MASRATSQADEQALAEQRRQVLRRTLRGLPDPMLAALRRGLEAHADELVAGRLYKSRGGGGCAVGVMLRELDPELGTRGLLRFWLRERWRRGSFSYRGPVGRNPRLKHLEWIFDSLAKELGPAAAGRYVRAEAEREMQWRALAGAPSLRRDRGPVAAGT